MRVAANFGVPRVDLVSPLVDPRDPEIQNWACGGDALLELHSWESLAEAAAEFRTLVATASGRGRNKLPVVTPREAGAELKKRGLDGTALVFGNESNGLAREDLDRCDLVVRIPTAHNFPVLNLAQAVAILVAEIHMMEEPLGNSAPVPASLQAVDGLMSHLRSTLLTIGFLDPKSPQRILRKLRRLFGRAGITDNEVTILRGICRQMDWAAGTRPGRFSDDGVTSGGPVDRP